MTAIPYNDELIQTLSSACDSYSIENSLEAISELTIAFLSGIIPQRFKEYIQNTIESNELSIIVPNEALVCMAQYTVLSRIQDEEDKLKQSVYATMLMNYMIVRRNQFHKIPNREEILSVYKYHISQYLALHDRIKIGMESELRAILPNYKNEISELMKDHMEEIRAVYKESTFYLLEKRLESERIRNIENPFVRMFIGLNDMLNHIPYFYYNININNIFSKLCNEKELRSRKKLSSILSDIRNYTNECKFNDNTAILLRTLRDEKPYSNAWTNVLNQKFNLKEFSIYLYFEILIDKMIDSLKNI